MPVKKLKPYTSTTRYYSILDFSDLDKVAPRKSLLDTVHFSAGRMNSGRISVRRKGGRHKRKYRIIDFRRDKRNIPAVVASLEYDPNRSAHLALLKYADGEYRYILAPNTLKKGDSVVAGETAPIRAGNSLPLRQIPPGSTVHNVEMYLGKGGQICRSAGAAAIIAGSDGDYVLIKLPSGELRKIHKECYATVGEVGAKDHNLVSVGKAGRSRWKGIRPHVRGVVMNPVDHPHGGGEGKTSGGRHPCTPWGQPTKGYKTRKKKNPTSKFIVQRRVNKRIKK